MQCFQSLCGLYLSFSSVCRIRSVCCSFSSCLERKFFLKTYWRTKSYKMETTKPPNVLIYTGEHPQSSALYENIQTNLKFCLNGECYIIYPLSTKQLLNDPWIGNTKLLVISCDRLDENASAVFNSYVEKGGDLLNFCSPLNLSAFKVVSQVVTRTQNLVAINYKGFKNVSLFHGKNKFATDNPAELLDENQTIFKIAHEMQNVVFSQVHLELDPASLGCTDAEFTSLNQSNISRLGILRDILSSIFGLDCTPTDIGVLTPCFLLTNMETDLTKQLKNLKLKTANNKKGFELDFQDYSNFDANQALLENKLPVLYNVPSIAYYEVPFDTDVYFKYLKTKLLGQNVFFADVVGTTMNVIESLSDANGAVVIARKQMQGRGRDTNKWISPIGCAMFSTHIEIHQDSILAKKLPIVQHLVALSAILAVRKTPGYEELDIRLKWPNDIYFGRNVKIAGILVNSCFDVEKCVFHIFTGCGFNVANTHPTLCLNAVIKFFNFQNQKNLAEFTCEELIAKSISEFEAMIYEFQTNGFPEFANLCYSYWLHDNQNVYLEREKKNVTVVGLDEYGFLVVEDSDGKKYTVQPDGNSFDLIKNLISMK